MRTLGFRGNFGEGRCGRIALVWIADLPQQRVDLPGVDIPHRAAELAHGYDRSLK